MVFRYMEIILELNPRAKSHCIWVAEIRGLQDWGKAWNHVCGERAYVSLCMSRSAARIGPVETEGLFAPDNMLTAQSKKAGVPFFGCFAYGGGRRASFFWFSGNKFFTPLLVRARVFSVELLFNFSFFWESLAELCPNSGGRRPWGDRPACRILASSLPSFGPWLLT